MLPFSHEQFIEVFRAYNADLWPAQAAAYVVASGIVWLIAKPGRASGRLVAAGLAAMWLWTGVAYHGVYFSAINAAAWGFAALFVLQGGLLLEAGVLHQRLAFGTAHRGRAAIGWTLLAYAALVYPLLGVLLGPGYPAMPVFGITPCPVTIFTWGVLLLARDPVPRRLIVVPALWSVVGGSAAFLLRVPQDVLLLASGLGALLLWRRRDPSRGRAAAVRTASAGRR